MTVSRRRRAQVTLGERYTLGDFGIGFSASGALHKSVKAADATPRSPAQIAQSF